jgi:hypothetical protein
VLIFSAILLASPESARPPAEDVVIIGRRLAATQGLITTNVLTGKSRCTVSKTSGDARIDKAVCDIAIACLKARQDGPAFKPCVADGRKRFIESLTNTQDGSEN